MLWMVSFCWDCFIWGCRHDLGMQTWCCREYAEHFDIAFCMGGGGAHIKQIWVAVTFILHCTCMRPQSQENHRLSLVGERGCICIYDWILSQLKKRVFMSIGMTLKHGLWKYHFLLILKKQLAGLLLARSCAHKPLVWASIQLLMLSKLICEFQLWRVWFSVKCSA